MTRRRRALAAGLGLACVGGLAATAVVGQTFRAGVDAVAVDVLVTRDGRPVIGLTADDFSLRDNDVPQRIDSVQLEDVPITLLLVLDTSGSVGGAPLVQLLAAAGAAAEALRPDDRVGLVTFSDKLRMVVEPPSPPSSVADALRRVRTGGATALYDATFAAFALREQTVGRTLMLVFSDGYDTASWLDPRDVLETAHRSDVVVYGVHLDRLARDSWWDRQASALARRWLPTEPHLFGHQFLAQLAEDTGGSVFVAKDIGGLRASFSRVVNEFRSRYLLTYSPDGVASGGWHALDVRIEGRGRTVQARRGYLR
jgi:VWFA-related protein